MKWKEQTIFSTVSISALSWDAFFFSSTLSCISRLLGYVHTILLDSLSWRHVKLSSIVWTPIRYVNLQFRDRRVAALLRHRAGTATTVLVFEQKPYLVWFSWRHEKVFSIVWTPIRCAALHFRDRRGVASLRHRNRATTTVLVCEQKPCASTVWFSWRRKNYLVSDSFWAATPRTKAYYFSDFVTSASWVPDAWKCPKKQNNSWHASHRMQRSIGRSEHVYLWQLLWLLLNDAYFF